MSFGLVGEKLSHSYSPIIHKMLGAYDYNLFEVAPEEFKDFIEEGNFSGLNVTIPYKEKAVELVKCDKVSQHLGAINTIYHKDGELRGTNTDFFGFMYLLSLAQIDLSDKKVLILGTGGASKVVQAIAKACEAKKVFVASRQKSKEYVAYNTLPLDVDVIVNATPVGTYPNITDRIIDLDKFEKCSAVIDLIYNPAKTDLLIQAEKKGIKFSNGLPMLVAQATKSAQHFIGMDFTKHNKTIIKNLKALTLNIALVGMPGAGKTSIGIKIAQLTGRKFVDLDSEIECRTGKTIPLIIAEEGEKYFRYLEKEILKEYAREKNLVIACGGGTVLDPENIDRLRQNSTVVEIFRDLKELPVTDRPFSIAAHSLEGLYEERKEFYDAAKDLTVVNDDSIENIANKILDTVGEYYEENY